jgi:hypothetical protein
MQLFGREVPSAEAVLGLYETLTQHKALWHPESFAATAKQCGLKRIALKKSGYFTFSVFAYATGQATISNGLIEEIRVFIGAEPKDCPTQLWEQDKEKLLVLTDEYAKMFETKLGPAKIYMNNKIFEQDGFRLRVLNGSSVWIVLSNLDILKQLPHDWVGEAMRKSIT